MYNKIGILREGLDKKGEKRVAVTPETAKLIVEWGHDLIVQPAHHPETNENKRAFKDVLYKQSGAVVSEDLSNADVIFGLKEINTHRILNNKVYLFFSHTHKGQIKNREMLKKLIDSKSTIIDYEFITDEKNTRLITAFTYNAGYAGMVDTLWVLGKRMSMKGMINPFSKVRQAIEEEHLSKAKISFVQLSDELKIVGTPAGHPPVIVCILGKGKTAHGAREMFDILPFEGIKLDQIKHVYENGSRKKIYLLHIDIEEIYRLKTDSRISNAEYMTLSVKEKQEIYFNQPDEFETNLDKVLPYITVLLNCITWSGKYPRTVTRDLIRETYKENQTLMVIGDITCDPNGSIEFSKENWIDNPVFIYNPNSGKSLDGFKGEGIAVMAITNLPCEFSADASIQFSKELQPLLKNVISADYKHSFESSNLAPELKKATIIWHGKFTDRYKYMEKYLK
ncbi:MAG: hypothetical protein PVF17_02480 [Ignavibacteria bacterium]|jgi:alpha-aminoadipic semialdehyde synthase